MSWVEISRRWHDTSVTNCRLCGRLIPRRIWVVQIAGREVGFCDTECERLYRTYWLPKYGEAAGEEHIARRL
jgi:hypothetical protein